MTSDSFLPRIQSVFYSVFDVQQGPKIIYQVPEGLVGVPENIVTPTSPLDYNRDSRSARSTSSSPVLFNFDDISKYVIPPSQLCGRLVTCSTKNHRVIGFPVELRGKYERNYFRYNLCFVFDRSADLSCYEPIVRKVTRVLSSCEKESGFLSNPETSPAIHAILEQLYEDLNSYSETSIPIDRFNSIELKIFPFYPNPRAVKDWMVPLALINITRRVEENWDLTMVKVCKFIDGTNHVSRIAHLADCDIALTRQAVSHLLFYQVIMTIDIFQYSNMYSLASSIQWLADESHVRDECGPYVTKPGHSIPDWPKLLRLYSRLKPGKTVLEWMQEHDVHNLGIDVRRFTSFGVIKGFLRRVHRYPVLLPPDPSQVLTLPPDPQLPSMSAFPRKRGNSLSNGVPLRFPPYTPSPPHADAASALLAGQPSALFRGRSSSTAGIQSGSPDRAQSNHTAPDNNYAMAHTSTAAVTITPISATHRARRASAAEKVLEQLRSRSDIQKSGSGPIAGSPRTSWIHYQQKDESSATSTTATAPQDAYTPRHPESRRQSLITPIGPPPSPVLPKTALPPSNSTTIRQRQSWSQTTPQPGGLATRPFPPEFLALLDGEHHTDELAVRFEAGWPVLEQWLVAAGGGAGNGDFGRVCIIYR
ncbi:putative nitrogen permease regulator 2 [Lyophyllum shimeji]|uniref:Nitrogen permease regulator 2 n=1 Tax=Lyophyllum shimeji TaxID=47721 RepID=A0A9P3PF99_LYOSH|nr:putative nitrogen permease regulator 2 [Lyophyllum shimeji]